MHWPLVLNLGDAIPKDLGDPLPQSWQIAWGGHALAHQPLELFQSKPVLARAGLASPSATRCSATRRSD